MDNHILLLRTACRLFANRGFDAVGVQEIVENTGLTKPTLYHYFGSKQGLYSSILETYLNPFLSELSRLCIYSGDMTNSLEKIASHYFKFAEQEPSFFRLWMTVRLNPPQSSTYMAINPYQNLQQKQLSDLFLQAASQHGNMRGRQNAYAISFLGLLYAYVALALQDNSALDDQLVYNVVHQFMHGIFS
jgi:TetR/AcrR family transcriptional regulator